MPRHKGNPIARDGDEERIVVTGNLLYASLDRLAKQLQGDPAARSVLDLSRVPYCDAAPRRQTPAGLRFAHGASASAILGIFLVMHLGNHLVGL